MYYYILEQPKDRASQRFRERLADQTTDVGIAGEMVATSPLKTIDELVDIGMKKGYNTIVAVGGDAHIQRVAAALMRQPPADRPVLGTIPTQSQSLVATLVNVGTFKDALQALKVRRLAYATLASIDPGKFLMTQALITTPKPTIFELDIDEAHVEVEATDLILTGDCHVEVRHRGGRMTAVKRGLAWFVGASLPETNVSIFHGERIRINARAPLSLVYEGETLAKTPVVAHLVRRALKIVVARATVATESKGSAELRSDNTSED